MNVLELLTQILVLSFLGEFKIVLWIFQKTFVRVSSIDHKILHESMLVLTAILDFEVFQANIIFFQFNLRYRI